MTEQPTQSNNKHEDVDNENSMNIEDSNVVGDSYTSVDSVAVAQIDEEAEKKDRRKHTFLAAIGLPMLLMLIIVGSLIIMTSYALYVTSTGGSLPMTEEGLMDVFLGPPLLSILLIMQFVAFIVMAVVAKGMADATSFPRFFFPSTYKGFAQKMGLPTKFDGTFWRQVLNGALLGVLLLVTLMGLNLLLELMGQTPQSSETSEQLGSSGSLWVLIFIVPILGPFAEELFFRGYLMGYLTYRGRSDVKVSKARAITAVAITSILFGLLHAQGFSSFNDIFVIFWTGMLGAVLAITYVKTRKITMAIIAHMVYNGISVIIMVSAPGLITFF